MCLLFSSNPRLASRFSDVGNIILLIYTLHSVLWYECHHYAPNGLEGNNKVCGFQFSEIILGEFEQAPH